MPEGSVINVISRIMNFTRFGKRVRNWHSRKNEKKVGGLLSFVTCLIAVTKNGFKSPTVAIWLEDSYETRVVTLGGNINFFSSF